MPRPGTSPRGSGHLRGGCPCFSGLRAGVDRGREGPSRRRRTRRRHGLRSGSDTSPSPGRPDPSFRGVTAATNPPSECRISCRAGGRPPSAGLVQEGPPEDHAGPWGVPGRHEGSAARVEATMQGRLGCVLGLLVSSLALARQQAPPQWSPPSQAAPPQQYAPAPTPAQVAPAQYAPAPAPAQQYAPAPQAAPPQQYAAPAAAAPVAPAQYAPAPQPAAPAPQAAPPQQYAAPPQQQYAAPPQPQYAPPQQQQYAAPP